MNLEDVTVIVPTKNEETNIVRFLNSLPATVKLIVVDDSEDNTQQTIQDVRPEKTRVLTVKGNIPLARQSGTESAETGWLLFSDADMEFGRDYFDNLARLAISEKTGAIMGAKLSRQKYRVYYRCYSAAMHMMSLLGIPIGSGSNMLIRKEALLAVGGFDKRLAHSEDSDILIRIKKAGWKVPYSGTLKVYETDHRRLEQGVFKKFWHGALRSFYLFTGWRSERVHASDWGYWSKK